MKKAGLIFTLLFLTQAVLSQTAISVVKNGRGSCLMFLPGFTSPGSVWDETIKNLDTSYESHVVSYAGFNGKTPIGFPWYEAIRQELLAYIKKEKLTQVTIIAHSMGGNLALDVAAELPGRVKGLILVESIPCMRELMMPGVPASSLQYNSPYNSKLLSMPDEDFKKMVTGIAKNMTNITSKVEVLSKWAIEADRKTYVFGYTDLLKLDLRDKLTSISAPTLIIGASFPTKEIIQSNYEKQYTNLKNQEIIIAEDSKHFIMFDQPEWLDVQINKYLHQHVK